MRNCTLIHPLHVELETASQIKTNTSSIQPMVSIDSHLTPVPRSRIVRFMRTRKKISFFFMMLPSILKVTHNKISDTAELNFEEFSAAKANPAASGVECSSHERFYCNSWAAVCET